LISVSDTAKTKKQISGREADTAAIRRTGVLFKAGRLVPGSFQNMKNLKYDGDIQS
jgi:hypothetical protein